MPVHDIRELLQHHEFFRGLDSEAVEFIAGCGANVVFSADEYLFREGESADYFFLVRTGRVALEVYGAERGPMMLDTVGEGGIVGASWLFPPYRWEFDARATSPVHAVRLDAVCLRDKCDRDPSLGYELMKRLAQVWRTRMQSARMRLLDLYGHTRAG
jgi:CRP-like cAMP-binding protein